MCGSNGFRADLLTVRLLFVRGFGFDAIAGWALPYVPEFAIAWGRDPASDLTLQKAPA
jgi:hypothetical protein